MNMFILIPANMPTGPVKGAYALANALINDCKVTLVTIKSGSEVKDYLDPRVQYISLENTCKSLGQKINHYKLLLREAGSRLNVISLSLCLSADFINIFCKKYAITLCSVRGNLFINYRHDYGFLGIGLAFLHLFSLRWVDHAVAMNQPMARQIKKYSGQKAEVFGSFIDEQRLFRRTIIKNKNDPFVFVFVGSLTSRKQPMLLIKALQNLKKRNLSAVIQYVGAGPEYKKIEEEAINSNLDDYVQMYGFLHNPEEIVMEADVLVLPSLSEGISRAAMEALYLGIPCVLRDVDGNTELVMEGFNGAVFTKESDLPDAMLRAASISRINKKRSCLLPSDFRRSSVINKYIKLIGIKNE